MVSIFSRNGNRFVRSTRSALLALALFAGAVSASGTPPDGWPLRFAPLAELSTGKISAPVGLEALRVFGKSPDLVVADANRGLILFENDGSGRFRETVTLPAGESATCVSAGALTGSDTLSLVTANMLDTFFTAFIPAAEPRRFIREDISVPSSPQTVAMTTLPGEDRSVVFIGLSARTSPGKVLLLRRTEGGWVRSAEVGVPWTPMGITPLRLKPEDWPRLVISPTASRSVAVARVLGPDRMELEQLLESDHNVIASSGAITPSVFVVAGVGGKRLSVWTSSHDFGSIRRTVYPAADPLTGVDVKDLNGDGRLDIAATSINALLVWRGTADGGFLPPQAIARANRGFAPVSEDLDGDGRIDVAWNNSIWRTLRVYRNVTPIGKPGDGNGDHRTDTLDIRLALKAIVTGHGLSVEEADRLDVAPVQPDGSWGDGHVTVEDAVRLLSWVAGA